MSIKVIRYRLPSYWACPLINDDYTGLTDEECEEIHKIQDMERLNREIKKGRRSPLQGF